MHPSLHYRAMYFTFNLMAIIRIIIVHAPYVRHLLIYLVAFWIEHPAGRTNYHQSGTRVWRLELAAPYLLHKWQDDYNLKWDCHAARTVQPRFVPRHRGRHVLVAKRTALLHMLASGKDWGVPSHWNRLEVGWPGCVMQCDDAMCSIENIAWCSSCSSRQICCRTIFGLRRHRLRACDYLRRRDVGQPLKCVVQRAGAVNVSAQNGVVKVMEHLSKIAHTKHTIRAKWCAKFYRSNCTFTSLHSPHTFTLPTFNKRRAQYLWIWPVECASWDAETQKVRRNSPISLMGSFYIGASNARTLQSKFETGLAIFIYW